MRKYRVCSVANQYMPVVAQHQYQARRAYCKPHNRLEHARLLEHVKHRLLECQWSPEEIAGRLRAEYGKCIIAQVIEDCILRLFEGKSVFDEESYRVCSECGKPILDWYYYYDEYYCEHCRQEKWTDEEWQKEYEDAGGDENDEVYWSSFD